MLSKVPLADDPARIVTLPTGEAVDLRMRFPASGLYAAGSTTSLWTVDWYGEQHYIELTADGRYLACLNRFGGGHYGQGIAPTWGVRFYDGGRRIAQYNVADLVDYPSLMYFETWDWHSYWLNPEGDDAILDGTRLTVHTGTHETYVFDMASGTMRSARHLWQPLTHVGLVVLVCVSAGTACLPAWRPSRGRRRSTIVPTCAAPPPEAAVVQPPRGDPRLQFSLRTALLAFPAFGLFLAGMLKNADLTFSIMLLPMLIAGPLLVTWRTRRFLQDRAARRAGGIMVRICLRTCVAVLWIACYVVSPLVVGTICEELDWPHDVQIVAYRLMYPLHPYRY